MPIAYLYHVYVNGLPQWFPDPWLLLKLGSAVGFVVLVKRYNAGTANPSETKMHGRVVLLTGGTSGIGAAVAADLAARGAQLVLLTRQPPADPFLIEYIDELRTRTANELIYAEQVDLASLHSVRAFATRWIDNAPPRRLDMVVLCAAAVTPPGHPRRETAEGVEHTWMVNFLANFHLLGILSPALRAQPFDRDVRVVFAACASYIAAPPLTTALDRASWSPGAAYARSKLALLVFAQAFQKHLDAYKRPDGLPSNTRVVVVDPGFARTPGMLAWATRGSVWGLVLYAVFYFVPWLLLKSAEMGAQSLLFVIMEAGLGRGQGGRFIKECQEVDFARRDVKDEAVAKELWEASDALIEKTEKAEAKRRAGEKQAKEDAEKAQEIEALVDTIKKGKERVAKEKEKEKETKPKSAKVRKSVRFGGKAVI